uniref:Uncharacterized protein n=1 Tax=Plectus sambesii TaxID=2011161 RepID=A0A914WC10_9BILA
MPKKNVGFTPLAPTAGRYRRRNDCGDVLELNRSRSAMNALYTVQYNFAAARRGVGMKQPGDQTVGCLLAQGEAADTTLTSGGAGHVGQSTLSAAGGDSVALDRRRRGRRIVGWTGGRTRSVSVHRESERESEETGWPLVPVPTVTEQERVEVEIGRRARPETKPPRTVLFALLGPIHLRQRFCLCPAVCLSAHLHYASSAHRARSSYPPSVKSVVREIRPTHSRSLRTPNRC